MPQTPEAGTWYMVVICEHCRSRLYLFRDLTDGKGSLSAMYFVTCPQCHKKGEYKAQPYRYAAR